MTAETGLFGLIPEAEFVVAQAGFDHAIHAKAPDGGLDHIATAACWPEDGPSDECWAKKIAELLALEHAAVLAGFKGVADRLAHAELAAPVVNDALSYAVRPSLAGLRSLKSVCLRHLAAQRELNGD